MAGHRDLFDSIVMADERFHGEGFRDGFAEGSGLGEVEGRRQGAWHGARVGCEIGCYRGFACAWRCLLHGAASERDSRRLRVLESLLGMIQRFPYDDPAYERLHEDLERIRGKFKQLCSLLSVQPDFRLRAGSAGLSF